MRKLKFYIVDVFAEKKYSGNQLAIFRDAGDLSDEEMQTLAREMNYSESTFIQKEIPENGGFPVRIFTPEEEVPFAGHPTLGTSFILQQEILKQQNPMDGANATCLWRNSRSGSGG
jgi:trans-2,3-dihydro-3-hydroxyanthranilate isomerase